MAPKSDNENVMDNLSKYTNKMRETAKKMGNKVTRKTPELSASEVLRRQTKEAADGLRKESHETALEYLQRRAAKLETSEDLDSLITSVAAYSKEIEKTATFCHKHDVSNLFDDSDLHFYRVAHPLVHVQGNLGLDLSFKTRSELMQKTFFNMPELPEILTQFVGKTWTTDATELENPDYKDYAEKALLLREDISRPFLLILREHLQSVQGALQEIEAWLVEPVQDAAFLNELCHSDLQLPWIDKPSLCQFCFEQTCLCSTFESEIHELLTTPGLGGNVDIYLDMEVPSDREKLRHLVAAAEVSLVEI